jgi:hypothetical protein
VTRGLKLPIRPWFLPGNQRTGIGTWTFIDADGHPVILKGRQDGPTAATAKLIADAVNAVATIQPLTVEVAALRLAAEFSSATHALMEQTIDGQRAQIGELVAALMEVERMRAELAKAVKDRTP